MTDEHDKQVRRIRFVSAELQKIAEQQGWHIEVDMTPAVDKRGLCMMTLGARAATTVPSSPLSRRPSLRGAAISLHTADAVPICDIRIGEVPLASLTGDGSGEKIPFVDSGKPDRPHFATSYNDFMRQGLRNVASARSTSYERLSADIVRADISSFVSRRSSAMRHVSPWLFGGPDDGDRVWHQPPFWRSAWLAIKRWLIRDLVNRD